MRKGMVGDEVCNCKLCRGYNRRQKKWFKHLLKNFRKLLRDVMNTDVKAKRD